MFLLIHCPSKPKSIYISSDNIHDMENEEHIFRLTIKKDIWSKFLESIPPQFKGPNEYLSWIIFQRVELWEGESNAKQKEQEKR